MTLRLGSLFSGYSGLEMGVQSVVGGTVAWHSEIDPGACKILAHRYPDVPNLGDITTVDWSQVEPVDVITGGSPCQDVSAAGKRAGMRAGTRSGLWAAMCDAIDIIRPSLVVWENVRGVLSAHADSAVEPCPICVGDERDAHLRALGRVVGDLSELGYVGRWVGLRAADVGAPHGRFRVFVVAWPAADAGRELWGSRPSLTGGAGARRSADEPKRSASTPANARGKAFGFGAGLRTDGGEGAGRTSTASADPDRLGHERARAARYGRGGFANSSLAPANASSDGRRATSDPPMSRLHSVGRDADGRSGADVAWGDYEPAIRRWEGVLGRPAPAPTELGAKGQPRLAPAFVEFLMGLPAGWVTDVPGITRNEALKALGNGVVPQQAAAALRMLLPVAEELAS